jgi:hypothetical protein
MNRRHALARKMLRQSAEIFRTERRQTWLKAEIEICMDLAIQDLAGRNIYQNLTATIGKKPLGYVNCSEQHHIQNAQNQAETTKIQGLLARCLELRSPRTDLENHWTRTPLTLLRGTGGEEATLVNHPPDCSRPHKTMDWSVSTCNSRNG